jgi:intracellular septation protein
MQTLIELAPLIAFFVAYAIGGMYVATPVLMAAMLLLVLWQKFKHGRVTNIILASAVMVWVFGAATLILHNARFIQWKSTVLYWLLAILLAGSCWVGERTLLERFMTAALPKDFSAPASTWKRTSLVAALFYAVLGAVNIYIAYTMSEKTWVFFKTWLMIPIVFLRSCWSLLGVSFVAGSRKV